MYSGGDSVMSMSGSLAAAGDSMMSGSSGAGHSMFSGSSAAGYSVLFGASDVDDSSSQSDSPPSMV